MKLSVVGKSGMGRDICEVRFGKWLVDASNDRKANWTKRELLEGIWYGEWLIHRISYKGFDLHYDTSDDALTLIRAEYKNYKKTKRRREKRAA